MKVLATLVATACALAATAPALAAENIVLNPGFELGGKWDTTRNTFYAQTSSGFPHSGLAAAFSTCQGEACIGTEYLVQTLMTDAGASYDLSLWVTNVQSVPETDFQQFAVFWNGASLGTVTFDGTAWTQFSYTGLVATGTETELRLSGRSDFSGIAFDDVSVVEGSAAPEAATWGLMITGFAATGAALRRRRGSADLSRA